MVTEVFFSGDGLFNGISIKFSMAFSVSFDHSQMLGIGANEQKISTRFKSGPTFARHRGTGGN